MTATGSTPPKLPKRCPIATRRASPAVMLDPDNLAAVDRWAERIEDDVRAHAAQAEVWLGETGNAQCGGEPGVSDRFVGSLWWLDELGRMARRGQPVALSGVDWLPCGGHPSGTLTLLVRRTF